ncbi:GTPase domain-containing protein [Iningainema tapete]|uniref:GTPase domain-containing protein n=1 Tax=Iningainema tapete BLCC-T55 TaxID=2748662 RepID=A0A8J6XIT2_9CYAN|nr:GTPase domain-containing protein [Iningainema tapete]MBD2775238.1 GTPase domain-containing protein [Iningainema tapete BLCC-T55]
MSVVVIGDRGIGKTSMVVALAKSATKHVKVVSNPEIIARRFNVEENRIAGTAQMTQETLLINIDLPSGQRQIQVLWIDTPGEAFSNREWQTNNPTAWRDIKQQISQSAGVILLLPPHRDLIQPNRLDERTDTNDLPINQAWVNRLEHWLNFFSENCTNYQHILVCIHRADTFCDIEYEGKKWRYDNSRNSLLYEYNNYIFKTYFTAANDLIRQYNSRHYPSNLQFFITTTDHPSLLELPWIYLGSYLANI